MVDETSLHWALVDHGEGHVKENGVMKVKEMDE